MESAISATIVAEPCSVPLARPPPPTLLLPLMMPLGVPALPLVGVAAVTAGVAAPLLLLLLGPESWRLVAVAAREFGWLTGEVSGGLRTLLADGGAAPLPLPLPLLLPDEESPIRNEALGFKPGGGAAVLGWYLG